MLLFQHLIKMETKIDCNVVLVSVGRKPNTQGLGLEKIGIKLDDKSRLNR